jgi:hypothetical protein
VTGAQLRKSAFLKKQGLWRVLHCDSGICPTFANAPTGFPAVRQARIMGCLGRALEHHARCLKTMPGLMAAAYCSLDDIRFYRIFYPAIPLLSVLKAVS